MSPQLARSPLWFPGLQDDYSTDPPPAAIPTTLEIYRLVSPPLKRAMAVEVRSSRSTYEDLERSSRLSLGNRVDYGSLRSVSSTVSSSSAGSGMSFTTVTSSAPSAPRPRHRRSTHRALGNGEFDSILSRVFDEMDT